MYVSSSYTCTSNPFRQTSQYICHTQTPMYRELGLVTTTKTSSQDTNPQLTPNTLYRSNRRSTKKSINFIDHQEDWQFSELHGNLSVMVGQNLWGIRPYYSLFTVVHTHKHISITQVKFLQRLLVCSLQKPVWGDQKKTGCSVSCSTTHHLSTQVYLPITDNTGTLSLSESGHNDRVSLQNETQNPALVLW